MAAIHETATREGKALRRVDLARATGCNLETIRYYETAGILPPPARTDAGIVPMARQMCSACTLFCAPATWDFRSLTYVACSALATAHFDLVLKSGTKPKFTWPMSGQRSQTFKRSKLSFPAPLRFAAEGIARNVRCWTACGIDGSFVHSRTTCSDRVMPPKAHREIEKAGRIHWRTLGNELAAVTVLSVARPQPPCGNAFQRHGKPINSFQRIVHPEEMRTVPGTTLRSPLAMAARNLPISFCESPSNRTS